MTERQQLRKVLRAKRKGLSSSEKRLAAVKLAENITATALFTHSKRIAGYLAMDGEIDPMFIMRRSLATRKMYYLPHLDKHRHLQFSIYQEGDACHPNQYGIPEPTSRFGEVLPLQKLDLVFVPLVGFDTKGNRLGMGAGYYDRTFAFLREQPDRSQPYLIGLAYEFQRVANLPVQDWDVPLDAIVTESAVYQINSNLML